MSATIWVTLHSCFTEPITGGRFSTAPAALISTGIMASRSVTSMGTVSTIFTFASPPDFRTGSIETGEMEPLRTSRKSRRGDSRQYCVRAVCRLRQRWTAGLDRCVHEWPTAVSERRKGQVSPETRRFCLPPPPQGTFTGAAVADYDRDGWLDIYFCLYIYYQGTDQYKYPLPYYDAENGPPNFMMRNNRDGTFIDVTSESGLDHEQHSLQFLLWWSDYNRDGWPDLYVVNDFGRKNLYRNNGDGTFTDVAPRWSRRRWRGHEHLLV